MSSPFSTPTKMPRLALDEDSVPPSPSTPVKAKNTLISKSEDLCDNMMCSYAQYISGSRTLLEMHPPQVKSASHFISKGEQIMKVQLNQLKSTLGSIELALSAKDRTIAYLRQELSKPSTSDVPSPKKHSGSAL